VSLRDRAVAGTPFDKLATSIYREEDDSASESLLLNYKRDIITSADRESGDSHEVSCQDEAECGERAEDEQKNVEEVLRYGTTADARERKEKSDTTEEKEDQQDSTNNTSGGHQSVALNSLVEIEGNVVTDKKTTINTDQERTDDRSEQSVDCSNSATKSNDVVQQAGSLRMMLSKQNTNNNPKSFSEDCDKKVGK
jgi:hypothetical protein